MVSSVINKDRSRPRLGGEYGCYMYMKDPSKRGSVNGLVRLVGGICDYNLST